MTAARIRIAVGVLLLLAAGVGVWFWMHRDRESTDDAQVDAHVTPIAARVGGTVLRVPVVDNQTVEAGTVLVEIDPREYQIALDRARELADLQLTQARDRFAAGVANNLEVVQAQEAVAAANEGAIAALYDLNIAKALVLGSPGSLEAAIEKYLGGAK